MNRLNRQQGFSYVEVLVAAIILLASLAPVIDTLRHAHMATEAHSTATGLEFAVKGRMESVLAESFASLLNAAAIANSRTVPTTYSDPAAPSEGISVYLWVYDVANKDGDNNPATMDDVDTDGDGNIFTDPEIAIDALWLRVAAENSVHSIETVVRR